MPKLRLFLLAALSCWVAICFVQCSARKPQDDFKATIDAYKKADNPAAKIRLWRDFLKRNPANIYTVFGVDYATQNYFLEQQKDPDGAVKFALEYLGNLKEEKLKRRADSTLILLYGKAGNKDLETYTTTPLLLVAVALLAGWLPARRATTHDVIAALRHQ